jgi:butyrate kinase
MVIQTSSGKYGNHVCNLGSRVALDLSRASGRAVALTTDTPTTDEMEPLARYSGLKEIPRVSCVQALNTKAMARYYAEEIRKVPFASMNLITVMLGGGIGVVAIRGGRMVDAPDALEGEGPFSNNRCCTVPIGALVKLCYSGKYDLPGMLRHINGEAGLMAYLGTTDIRAIMQRIEAGDARAREVMEAMCYQTAKEIGAMSTVLKGKVDAILLIGGMANVPFIVDHIRERVAHLGPVEVLPGEREMEALAEGAYGALTGQIPTLEFVPREEKA